MPLPEFLRAGLRVCSFRRPQGPPDGRVSTILLRAALGLALEALQSFLLNGRPGHFAWEVLPDLLFPVTLLWLLTWLIAGVLHKPGAGALLLADLLAARLVLGVVQVLAQLPLVLHPDDARFDTVVDWVMNALEIWWLLAVLARIGQLATGGRATLLFAWGLFATPWLVMLAVLPVSDFWQSDAQGDDASAPAQVMPEAVFHAQPALLEDAFDALDAERPGVDDLYFLGVAGDAGTPAFRNEVELAQRLLAQRFDTGGRSLLLVNDGRPEPRYPFATRTNIDAALSRLAEVMDVDDDILLIFLSSHGTRDHTVVLSQPALALADISPADLRQTLDEVGIRWRIVIVSACYSGGFVAPLREEHTMVITASDADHPSFGCSVSDRYTWFGQAFFDQQLPHTLSFQDAFRDAARAIAAREHATGEQASNPQIFVGAAMTAKLAALRARLSQPGGPAGSVQAGLTPPRGADADAPSLSPLRAAGHVPPDSKAFPPAPDSACRRRPCRQAGMSGVSEHARTWISSLRRSLRFLSRRSDSSSVSPSAT